MTSLNAPSTNMVPEYEFKTGDLVTPIISGIYWHKEWEGIKMQVIRVSDGLVTVRHGATCSDVEPHHIKLHPESIIDNLLDKYK